MQDGWKAWKKALKQSNQLDDAGFEDEAARAAAKMVADAHKNFGSKGKGKGKKAAAADEDEAEPFSLLHKVCRCLYVLPAAEPFGAWLVCDDTCLYVLITAEP